MADTRLPLDGQRVLVTRAASQASELSERLRALGAEVRELAAIIVQPPADGWRALDAAIARLAAFDWLVLTSPNGARMFLARAAATARPATLKLAAVGPTTAAILTEGGWAPDLVPARFEAKAAAEALRDHQAVAGKNVLWPRGNLAPPEIAELLEQAGATVSAVEAYQTCAIALDATALEASLKRGEIDWLTFASGSAFWSLHAALSDPAALGRARLASMGPRTSEAIRSAGHAVAAEASPSTLDGLTAALVAALEPPNP